jgi:predicted ATP-dependent serine protease
MKNTSNSTKPSKTFKCQSCGQVTPRKQGRSKYCLECGIKQNKLESYWALTETKKENRLIELAVARQNRMEAERLAFLAELQNEGLYPTPYAEEKAQEDAHLEFMEKNGII